MDREIADQCEFGHWIVASPRSFPLTQEKPKQEGETDTHDTLLPGNLKNHPPVQASSPSVPF